MSSKKGKFSSQDKQYMNLAINLARSRNGLTGNNPSVGCVIVKNNNIISIGQTGYSGRPHAEYNAIKNSIEKVNGSKMYITLEPCNHYGQTPPCTNNIIKNGIKEVYYSIDDIDKKVKGKSFNILEKKKIKVQKGLLKEKAKDLYESYLCNRLYKLPYVTGKIAITKNKLIYSYGNKRITDTFSEKLTHFLRYKNDAILISHQTLLKDNPKLNCRLKGYEKFSPIRIILDKNLEIKQSSYIFKSSKKKNTFIFHNSLNFDKIRILKKRGITLIKLKTNQDNLFNLNKILKIIFKYGIRNLLVEGGDKLTKAFLYNKLFDKFYLFKSPKELSKYNEHVNFTSLNILDKKYRKKTKIISKVANDKIIIYKR